MAGLTAANANPGHFEVVSQAKTKSTGTQPSVASSVSIKQKAAGSTTSTTIRREAKQGTSSDRLQPEFTLSVPLIVVRASKAKGTSAIHATVRLLEQTKVADSYLITGKIDGRRRIAELTISVKGTTQRCIAVNDKLYTQEVPSDGTKSGKWVSADLTSATLPEPAAIVSALFDGPAILAGVKSWKNNGADGVAQLVGESNTAAFLQLDVSKFSETVATTAQIFGTQLRSYGWKLSPASGEKVQGIDLTAELKPAPLLTVAAPTDV